MFIDLPDRPEPLLQFVQLSLSLQGLTVPELTITPRRSRWRTPCPKAKPAAHGTRKDSGWPLLAGAQLSLGSWTPPVPTRDMLVRRLLGEVSDLMARMDTAAKVMCRVETEVVSLRAPLEPPKPLKASPSPPADHKYPSKRPSHYAECLALGLGTDRPCPFYSCRAHMGCYVRDDGSIRILIDPEQLDTTGQHTCVHAASSHAWAPVDIAAQLHISLGLEELIQRHGVAKTGGVLGRFRDERRRCEMDIDGVMDCRT